MQGNVSQFLVGRYNFSPNCKVIAFTGDNPGKWEQENLQKLKLAVGRVQAEIFLEMKLGGFVFYNAFVGFYFVAKLIIFITIKHIKAAMKIKRVLMAFLTLF